MRTAAQREQLAREHSIKEAAGFEQNAYGLKWFSLMRYRTDRVVVFGVGHWIGHLMDWRGGNFYHGRIGPVFDTTEQAMAWLEECVAAGLLREGQPFRGHHSGEFGCSKGCDARELRSVVYFRDLRKEAAQ